MKPKLLLALAVAVAAGCDDVAGPDPWNEPAAGGVLALGGRHTCALTPTGRAHCWGSNHEGQTGHATIQTCRDFFVTTETSCTRAPWPVETEVRFTHLAAGGSTTCGLDAAGAAYCWGHNGGKFGDGGTDHAARPRPVAAGLRFRDLVVGGSSTCGLDLEGRAHCWGWPLADPTWPAEGPSLVPVAVPGNARFTTLSVHGGSYGHACGLTSEGRAYCWGTNGSGQLGTGATGPTQTTPQPVSGDLRFATLSVGTGQSCGITRQGALYCWGANFQGEAGHPPPPPGPTPARFLEPVRVLEGVTFRSVSAGSSYSCAIAADGALYCWGASSAPLGYAVESSPSRAIAPARVPGTASYRRVEAGLTHACALTGSGEVHCWGSNASGQLGNQSTTSSASPTPVWGSLRVGRPR